MKRILIGLMAIGGLYVLVQFSNLKERQREGENRAHKEAREKDPWAYFQDYQKIKVAGGVVAFEKLCGEWFKRKDPTASIWSEYRNWLDHDMALEAARSVKMYANDIVSVRDADGRPVPVQTREAGCNSVDHELRKFYTVEYDVGSRPQFTDNEAAILGAFRTACKGSELRQPENVMWYWHDFVSSRSVYKEASVDHVGEAAKCESIVAKIEAMVPGKAQFDFYGWHVKARMLTKTESPRLTFLRGE